MELFNSHTERIQILNAANPLGPGFYLLTTAEKNHVCMCTPADLYTFACLTRLLSMEREKAWTSRFSADREFLAFSCGEDHVSEENRRWSRSICACARVCAVIVCVKPWHQLWNQCCKTLACVTFWQRKTAPPLPTTKGRGQEHVSGIALRSSAVVNSSIKIMKGLSKGFLVYFTGRYSCHFKCKSVVFARTCLRENLTFAGHHWWNWRFKNFIAWIWKYFII